MFCTQCGVSLPDGATLCPACGTAVQAGSQPQRPRESPEYTAPETDGRAVASLVAGILAPVFSIFAGVPAIILGHKALAEVKKSAGRLTGESLALVGMVLGYFSVALLPFWLMVIIPRVTHFKTTAIESAAESTVHALNSAEISYSETYPNAGFAPDLATLGPGGPTCPGGEGTQKNACLIESQLGCREGSSGKWCSKDRYNYSLVGIRNGGQFVDYIVTATPADSGAGKRSYCSTAEAVVRFREEQPLSEPLKTDAECRSWQVLPP